MKVRIRRAIAEDCDAVWALYGAVDELHRINVPHLFKEPEGPPPGLDAFWELLMDEGVALFVAEAEGELVGFVHAVLRDTPPVPILVPHRFATVDGIGVKPAFRNLGIGRALMEAVHRWALAEGATDVELDVYEFNETAMAFYRGLGYETLSRKMHRLLDGG